MWGIEEYVFEKGREDSGHLMKSAKSKPTLTLTLAFSPASVHKKSSDHCIHCVIAITTLNN